MKRNGPEPVWTPHPVHFLLLRAALADPPDATRAWAEWKRAVGGVDRVDAGSFRLLPLVYRNLLRAESADPAMPVLKGVYRQTWLSNHLVMGWAGRALRALDVATVPALVLKGAALGPLHYRDLGVRPMEDLDLLVPERHAAAAMDVLEQEGFRPRRSSARDAIGIRHAEAFEDAEGRVVDLHWSLLWGSSPPTSAIWDAAVPLEVGGVEASAPGPADQLLHACLHGASWNPTPPLRSIADAAVVIRSAGADLDWERLGEMARAARRTVPLAAALTVLRDKVGAPVPREVIADLRRDGGSRWERRAHMAMARPPSAYRYAGMGWLLWRDHREYLRGLPASAGRIGFLEYLKRMAFVDSFWQLPRRVVSRRR